MGDESFPLFVVLPIVLIIKIGFWVAVCYRCSNRPARTTVIQRTVIQGPVENGITGIENPGYLQQPPAYTDATGSNPRQASVPPSYEQMTKGLYFAEDYGQGASRY
ncbi:uncharacterized protein LOC134721915 [Mytilus trossulus]|uniref:uncharacterized protein LOC134721915 n=1 Tax=Mytilus trossulus TaxID=6551 RepID=UPI0030048CC5